MTTPSRIIAPAEPTTILTMGPVLNLPLVPFEFVPGVVEDLRPPTETLVPDVVISGVPELVWMSPRPLVELLVGGIVILGSMDVAGSDGLSPVETRLLCQGPVALLYQYPNTPSMPPL